MSNSWIYDLVHEIMHRANQEAGEQEFHVIGHCIEYDPAVHMGRFLIPSLRAEDDNGNDQPMETGWCQLGTGMVGNGWGLQYALKGGATAQNPEQGEMVQLSVQNKDTGLMAVANLTFNDTMPPPGAGNGETQENDPQGTNQLASGEFILKHESGSFLKFYENGDVQLYTANDLRVRVQQDLNVTVVEGDLNIDVQAGDAILDVTQGDITATAGLGDITVEALAGTVNITGAAAVEVQSAAAVDVVAPSVTLGDGTLQPLCNLSFLEWANSHTHTDPQGGTTGTPTVPAVEGVETTINTTAS